jgi:hypothetical protein
LLLLLTLTALGLEILVVDGESLVDLGAQSTIVLKTTTVVSLHALDGWEELK